MTQTMEASTTPFVERRQSNRGGEGRERRQFTNSYAELNPDARELATAIDSYKAMNRRRYISYDEMLTVIQELGYRK